ncbi:MAG: outer membrane beta-barrel protein [Holophaga sp.]|nr:outer membrane beta-barrel protein [Holophaga sp.]
MKPLSAIALFTMTGASLWASGFGVGVQTAFDLGDGHAIAPRLEYQRYTDSSSVAGPVLSPIDMNATVNCFSLGADYNYFFSGRTGRGFYVLGGLGVASASFNVTASTAGLSSQATSHQTVLYPEAGAGYQFNRNLGLEVLYKDLRFDDVNLAVAGTPVGYSFSGSLQADLVLRF